MGGGYRNPPAAPSMRGDCLALDKDEDGDEDAEENQDGNDDDDEDA